MLETYTIPQIKEAVDIAIGDDGFRSKEVIEILRLDHIKEYGTENDMRKMQEDLIEFRQSLINIDAKYKMKCNEIFLILEKELLNASTSNK
jgi:hypothetical protein